MATWSSLSCCGWCGARTRIQTNQEDWGWFIWFRKGTVRLAIDVFTEDADAGIFRVHLTTRSKRWRIFDNVADRPELNELRDVVVAALGSWAGAEVSVKGLDSQSMDVDSA